MRICIIFLFCFYFSFTQTTVEKTNDQWHLMVNGEQFNVKGATFGYVDNIDNYDTYFKDLKFLGVNTIRTWATGKNTKQLLDVAEANGIKVMMGIWMRHGRPGMEDDDSFNYLEDKEGMEAMYLNAIEKVKSYKDHPAVLMWGIGNEVYLNMATDEEKLAYSKLLERICFEMKVLDPNHPITSVEAWTFGLDWWEKHVPSIDIYGLNSYGAGANYLQGELDKRDIDKPYVITEFGVTGEWDIKDKKNGVTIEPSDAEKYEAITGGYRDWISNKPSCLGVYMFHYNSGNQFMAPWLFTHVNDFKRPQYWAIREAYTGNKPTNNVPVIKAFQLPNDTFKSETWIPVTLEVEDIENDQLEASFSYNQRIGSRKRRDQINALSHRGNLKDGFEIKLPQEDGAIKIYAKVNDSFNNMGIASTSILVEDEKARAKQFKVPKVSLPFYVYEDNEEPPYFASGYMGNYKDLDVDVNYKREKHSGTSSIRIHYKAISGWYGIAFVDPANDWGYILGGYDISGAKTFSFWAKSDFSGVSAKIGFGLIDKDKPFPDTSKTSINIDLTSKWKKYTIKTKKLDLSCIRSGLVLFSNGYGSSHKIYIDDVVFE